MTVAATAKRRRKQAVMGFRQMARIGRGNNNRPYYSKHSVDTLERREAQFRERSKMLAMRVGKKRKR